MHNYHNDIDGAQIMRVEFLLVHRAHRNGESTTCFYRVHKNRWFPLMSNRTTAARNRNGGVSDQAGGYAERAHCHQCDGPIIMCSAQRDGALIVPLRRCHLDLHSRRKDDSSGPYGERVGVYVCSASSNYLQARSIVLYKQTHVQPEQRFCVRREGSS